MKDWKDYQEEKYNKSVCNLLINFLDNYKIKNAIDLGCGSGNETVYMLNHNINVLSVDKQLNKQYILDRIDESKYNNITFLEHEFEDIELPKTDAIMAFFSIPFCNPKKFDNLWDTIYNSLNNNGYFVGQLFGNRDDWKDNPLINTFTIDEVKKYLQKYKILKLEEVEYIREKDNKKWHFYEIIAQK